MRALPVYLVLLVLFALVLSTQTGAQSIYLSATPIPSTLTTTQIWMAGPFCVRAWWGPLLCSENKGDEHHLNAPYKLDFLPAWLALEGKDVQGRWTLHSIAKTNDQSPGANFVAVTGPSLVTVLNSVTPPAVTPSPPTVTAPPSVGVTATPTATGGVATFTPSPPAGGLPTLSPAQRHGFRVICDDTGRDYTLDIWGYWDLVYTVPDSWCAESRNGIQNLFEHMAQATPKVKVWP